MSESFDDPLLPERLEPEITDLRLFRGKVRYYPSTDSTNTRALAHAAQGDPEGGVFIAEAQEKGRGKPGRSWFSQPGEGIYVSLLLRPKVEPMRVPLLTLLGAVAVSEAVTAALGEYLGEQAGGGRAGKPAPVPDIKWPNDVLLNGRKLCGILSEMALLGDQSLYAVVGIGLNVHQAHFPPPLDQWATSLFIETGRRLSRVELLARILKSFETWYNQFVSRRFEAITTRWCELSTYAYGRPITVEKDGVLLSGVTRGLDAYGALRLECAAGRVETIVAGDIFG